MTIVKKIDNPGVSIILDNVVCFYKGDTIYTGVASYGGWHCLNFVTVTGKTEQWDYGKTEEGKRMRDDQYEKIASL